MSLEFMQISNANVDSHLYFNEAEIKAREAIPKEVWLEIFKRLTLKDIIAASKVCKKWYQICKNNTLWLDLIPEEWKPPSPVPDAKEYFFQKTFNFNLENNKYSSRTIKTLFKKN